MPLNISGQYVWLSGERYAYVYIEGELRTELAMETVHAALGSQLVRQLKTSGEHTAYQIPHAEVFDLLLVRQDKRCALIAATPVDCTHSSVFDRLTQMAEEVRTCSQLIARALRLEGGVGEIVFEQLNCQVAVTN